MSDTLYGPRTIPGCTIRCRIGSADRDRKPASRAAGASDGAIRHRHCSTSKSARLPPARPRRLACMAAGAKLAGGTNRNATAVTAICDGVCSDAGGRNRLAEACHEDRPLVRRRAAGLRRCAGLPPPISMSIRSTAATAAMAARRIPGARCRPCSTRPLIETQDWPSYPYADGMQLVTVNAGAPVRAGDTIWLRSGYHGDLVDRARVQHRADHDRGRARPVAARAQSHRAGRAALDMCAASRSARRTRRRSTRSTWSRSAITTTSVPAWDIELGDSALFSVDDASAWGRGRMGQSRLERHLCRRGAHQRARQHVAQRALRHQRRRRERQHPSTT